MVDRRINKKGEISALLIVLIVAAVASIGIISTMQDSPTGLAVLNDTNLTNESFNNTELNITINDTIIEAINENINSTLNLTINSSLLNETFNITINDTIELINDSIKEPTNETLGDATLNITINDTIELINDSVNLTTNETLDHSSINISEKELRSNSVVTLDITGTVTNYNIASAASGAGASDDVVVNVKSGAVVGGTSISTAAMSTGGLNVNSLTINVESGAYIVGKGGYGNRGEGGDALSITFSGTIINNQGTIAGGGGGGSWGSCWDINSKGACSCASAGGGGGAGYDSVGGLALDNAHFMCAYYPPDGSPGTLLQGGLGGPAGTTGGVYKGRVCGFSAGIPGASLGDDTAYASAGNYVVGQNNVVWTNLGTALGGSQNANGDPGDPPVLGSPDGTACTANSQCTSGYCRLDYDLNGNYCASSSVACVYDFNNDNFAEGQAGNGYELCNGDGYRTCSNGGWGGYVTCVNTYQIGGDPNYCQTDSRSCGSGSIGGCYNAGWTNINQGSQCSSTDICSGDGFYSQTNCNSGSCNAGGGSYSACNDASCSSDGDGSYSALTDSICVGTSCSSQSSTDCGVYSCSGTVCATNCATDNNALCRSGYHCYSGNNQCYTNANGGACDSDSECSSGRCDSTCQAKVANGVSCDEGSDCTSGYCRTDYDGSGQFCANTPTACVHDANSDNYAESFYGNYWHECLSSTQKECINGVWQNYQVCDTTIDYQYSANQCGWQSQGVDSCNEAFGGTGGCIPPAWSPVNDCGDLQTTSTSSCNTNGNIAYCSTTCGADCTSGQTQDSGVDICSNGVSYNRWDICAISSQNCYFADNGLTSDTPIQDCDETCGLYADRSITESCINGACQSCPTICASNVNCDASAYCAAGSTCQLDLAVGQTCDEHTDCVSGICTDGVCCGTACDGTCESCAVSGSEGTCTPEPEGTDPKNECSPGAYSCVGSCQRQRKPGTCDGQTSACEVEDWETDYMEVGKVCSSGNEVAPNSGVYCDRTINCIDDSCGADKYYRGCTAGATSCTDTGRVSTTGWNAPQNTVISETTYKVGISCAVNTNLCGYGPYDRCTGVNGAGGDRQRDEYRCDGSNTCDFYVGDDEFICDPGCCLDSGATTSCQTSGTSPSNWWNFNVYDNLQTDYCLNSVIYDCGVDTDCLPGFFCDQETRTRFI